MSLAVCAFDKNKGVIASEGRAVTLENGKWHTISENKHKAVSLSPDIAFAATGLVSQGQDVQAFAQKMVDGGYNFRDLVAALQQYARAAYRPSRPIEFPSSLMLLGFDGVRMRCVTMESLDGFQVHEIEHSDKITFASIGHPVELPDARDWGTLPELLTDAISKAARRSVALNERIRFVPVHDVEGQCGGIIVNFPVAAAASGGAGWTNYPGCLDTSASTSTSVTIGSDSIADNVTDSLVISGFAPLALPNATQFTLYVDYSTNHDHARVGKLKIEYSVDGGTTWTTVIDIVPDSARHTQTANLPLNINLGVTQARITIYDDTITTGTLSCNVYSCFIKEFF